MKRADLKAPGCGCLLTKPIDRRELPRQIAGFLQRAAGERNHWRETINILVIEDDPTHLKLAKVVLSAAGHKVRDADAAERAFDAIKQERPDVILLDLVLPAMDGLTLVRKLKADPETSAISVVAVTSYPERFTMKDALAAGCEAYLVKPIDTRKLPRVISDVAKGSSLTEG
jgi:two-component system, cell cycle response regulator